jgi:hypothetical protein
VMAALRTIALAASVLPARRAIPSIRWSP